MLVVALTGGIGSGKSLVGQYFSHLGAIVLDADHLAHEAIARGNPGFDAVVHRFGDGILRDGQISREELAKIVFTDASARVNLEEIIHPIVRKEFESAVSRLHSDQVLIYEIPLLIETHSANRFDYVIAVESEAKVRTARLMERGMRLSQIQARIIAQATDAQRGAVADCIISNQGSADLLLREVERIWELVLPPLQREKR